MIIKTNIAKAIYDFEWVLRVLESSKDENHMDCVLKCFYLWEKKHSHLKVSSKFRRHFGKVNLLGRVSFDLFFQKVLTVFQN